MEIGNYLPQGQYRYYYSRLPHAGQKAYSALLQGLLRFSGAIPCGCSVEEAQKIYEYLRLDVPEVFYVKTIRIRYSPLWKFNCTILPEYRFDKKTSIKTLAAIEERYAAFLLKLRGLSEWEKEKQIHDLLTSQVKYQDRNAPYSHEAPGALLYNIGVCEGMAKAFKYLADRAGLQSLVVVGTSQADAHAWNVVRIDQSFYHLDVTFDATLAAGCLRYDYFDLSDREMAADHQWESALPTCPSSFSFYEKQGLFFETKSELRRYIKEAAQNEDVVIFQLPAFNAPPEKIVAVVSEAIQSGMNGSAFRQRGYTMTYNLSRMVFQVNVT